jgi:hypothetical protein
MSAVLEPAVAARTALACTHSVQLVRGGGRSSCVALDDEGEPLQVAPTTVRPCGPARVVVDSPRPEIGRVWLEGTLEELSGRRRSAALVLYRSHLRCFGAWEPVPVELFRLNVNRVLWAGGAGGGASWRDVRLADYATARPCPWTLYGDQLVAHLNSDHATLVDGLAVRLSGCARAVGWITSMTRHGVTVAAVDPDGTCEHHLRYGRPLADPQCALAAIRRWVADGVA